MFNISKWNESKIHSNKILRISQINADLKENSRTIRKFSELPTCAGHQGKLLILIHTTVPFVNSDRESFTATGTSNELRGISDTWGSSNCWLSGDIIWESATCWLSGGVFWGSAVCRLSSE